MNIFTQAKDHYEQNGFVSLIKEFIRHINRKIGRKFVQPVRYHLWNQFNIGDVDSLYGEEYYLRMSRKSAQADAEATCEILVGEFEPRSVIDLGCGVGRFLRPFHQRGISVYGVDAAASAINNSLIPTEYLDQHDLREPLTVESRYDLVICFEVLEHLSEDYANIIVSTISDAGDIAVVTAATPGQGGSYHMNEQPKEYWIDKFQKCGMVFLPEKTKHIRAKINVEELSWVTDNLLIFQQANSQLINQDE